MIDKRKPAIDAIRHERARQLAVEGYSPAHDAEHERGELLEAARCYYEAPAVQEGEALAVPTSWPFEDEFWKPRSRRRNLERAGALAMADRDRLIRRADDVAAAGRLEELDLAKPQAALRVILGALLELDAREIAAEQGDVSTRAPDAPQEEA